MTASAEDFVRLHESERAVDHRRAALPVDLQRSMAADSDECVRDRLAVIGILPTSLLPCFFGLPP